MVHHWLNYPNKVFDHTSHQSLNYRRRYAITRTISSCYLFGHQRPNLIQMFCCTKRSKNLNILLKMEHRYTLMAKNFKLPYEHNALSLIYQRNRFFVARSTSMVIQHSPSAAAQVYLTEKS